MNCNTEEECTQLVNLLPPTEAALLDWAINLMADVVHNEHYNKMNARNIAMVFAPNMTQVLENFSEVYLLMFSFSNACLMKTEFKGISFTQMSKLGMIWYAVW